MKKILLILIIVALITLAACNVPINESQNNINQNTTNNNNIVGNDRDEHGCIGSAGYAWCEEKQECIRPWEENCTAKTENENLNLKTQCTNNDGKWIEKANECEGLSKETCETLNGTFNECASACRNNPSAKICTMQCVVVCEFKE